nr:endonuclease domain-containing protein [Streptomyces sp. 3211]
MCAVCVTASAAVLDHCHEHGYIRAPVCLSCNTRERPDHLYTKTTSVSLAAICDSSTPTRSTGSGTGTAARAAAPAPPCPTLPHGPPTQPPERYARLTPGRAAAHPVGC